MDLPTTGRHKENTKYQTPIMYPRINVNLEVPYNLRPYRHHGQLRTRTRKRQDTDIYGKELKIYWILMKILLANPITVDSKTGTRKFSLISLSTLYFCVMYSFLTFALSHNLQVIFKGITLNKGTRFQNAIFSDTYLLFNCFHMVPFILFLEGRKIARYGNRWRALQEKFYVVTGRPVVLNIKRSVRVYLCFTLAAVVTTPIFLYITIAIVFTAITPEGKVVQIPYYAYIQQAFLFGVICAVVGHWHILNNATKAFATDLIRRLQERVRGEAIVTESEMSLYEELWLDLLLHVRGTGPSFSYTITYVLTLMFLMTIIGGFMAISRIAIEPSLMAAAPFCIVVAPLAALIQIPWCSHNVTAEVGENFRNAVQQLRLELTSEDTRLAADRFVYTITINPPIIDLNGFVVLNKEFGTSMLGTMVTYLVVLIQFQLTFNST